MQLDFLPDKIKIKRNGIRLRIIFAYTFVAVCIALTAMWYVNSIRIQRTADDLAQLDGELTSMNKELEQLVDLEKKLAGLKLKQRIDVNLGTRVDVLDVLRELGRMLPDNMALTDIKLESQPVNIKFKSANAGNNPRVASSVSRKKVNRVMLLITGVSNDNVSVANFIADLSASRLFEDVSMGYSRKIDFRGKEAKEFQANCYVMR